ncbi:hypothetical protein [Salinisphaera sp. C84B14]|uniref:hypothetical protein n=1 Tax=Salinisphaera sp. C84B14 TaxID=1304155 RepID=UPI00333F9381
MDKPFRFPRDKMPAVRNSSRPNANPSIVEAIDWRSTKGRKRRFVKTKSFDTKAATGYRFIVRHATLARSWQGSRFVYTQDAYQGV